MGGDGGIDGPEQCGLGDGVWKSADGGRTFTQSGLRETYQISEIAPHPTNADIVYVAAVGNLWGYTGSRGLCKTTDGGATFRELTNGLPAGETGQIDIDVYRTDPRIVVAFVEADETLATDLSVPGPGVYRSDDAGETWRYVVRNNSRPYYHGRVRIHPTDEQRIYLPSRQFMHSLDGGRTWRNGKGFPSAGGDDHDLWISPQNPDVFYSATDQGSSITLGGPALQFQNMAVGQYYAIGVDMRDPYWVYGGLEDNGGWAIPSHVPEQNEIGTQNAIEVNGGDGFHMDTDPADWRTLYSTVHVGFFGRIDVVTGSRRFITPTPATTVNFAEYYDPAFGESQTDYTINGEENWFRWPLPNRTINGAALPPQFRWNWNSPLAVSPLDGRTIYVGSNYVFKSTDRGDTWRIISPDLTKNQPELRNSTESGGLVRDVTGNVMMRGRPVSELRPRLLELDTIAVQLTRADAPDALNRVRSSLIEYSQVVGDASYTGFFGNELRPAAAGEYAVRVVVDGRTYVGTVRVREDPRFD